MTRPKYNCPRHGEFTGFCERCEVGQIIDGIEDSSKQYRVHGNQELALLAKYARIGMKVKP